MSTHSSLLSDDVVIVIAQTLTGLGHLRVSHALYHGKPKGVSTLLLTSADERINYLHKITSINPFLRSIMEYVQAGWAEGPATFLARQYFRHNSKSLKGQLQKILDQRIIRPKTLLVIATHTNLAHQLASIKDEFEKKNNVRVVLVVIVTDDTPQKLWAVGGADFIIVPSESTKRKLNKYHHTQLDMAPSRYVVLPYMVSPELSIGLPEAQFRSRTDQMNPIKQEPIHVAIPISGAAVQLGYFEKLVGSLKETSSRFIFHIVSLERPATSGFLARMKVEESVKLFSSRSHREVVEAYERLYDEEVIGLEVTKPSEQLFKALLSPRTRGGSILLFSDPVGRQERDNLLFLARHNLIPNLEQQQALWAAAMGGQDPEPAILKKAKAWRGIFLPFHSEASAQFILWCLKQKVFAAMIDFSGYPKSPEISAQGVELFWKMMDEYLEHREISIPPR